MRSPATKWFVSRSWSRSKECSYWWDLRDKIFSLQKKRLTKFSCNILNFLHKIQSHGKIMKNEFFGQIFTFSDRARRVGNNNIYISKTLDCFFLARNVQKCKNGQKQATKTDNLREMREFSFYVIIAIFLRKTTILNIWKTKEFANPVLDGRKWKFRYVYFFCIFEYYSIA